MASAIPTINDRFEIIEQIGEGGFAEVFKVLDKVDNQM